MYQFTLYLSPIDELHFKAIGNCPNGNAETDSELPFGDPARRVTLLKALDVMAFRVGDFEEREQEWMVQNSWLAQDRATFHPIMRTRIGQALYQSLFPAGSPIEELLTTARGVAERDDSTLHLQIKIPADAAKRARLWDYPWELLHDGDKFLAHGPVIFSRYIAYSGAPPNHPQTSKINILLISSRACDEANNLPPLPHNETQAIRAVLEDAHQQGYVHVDTLRSATLDAMRDYLTSHRGDATPHVIHFDGHGFYGRCCTGRQPNGLRCEAVYSLVAEECTRCGAPLPEPQGFLLFEGKDGQASYISAYSLGTLLHNNATPDDFGRRRGVAVMVLNACRSAASLAGSSVFYGVAQNLIDQRVPAVVAMLFPVSVAAAEAFAQQFYRALAQKDSLAVAVSQGREAMGPEGDQWYRPILYVRWEDNDGGQVFSQASIVEKGLETLQDLMKDPAVAAEVERFRADFEAAREQICAQSYYKGLHDLLHTVQIQGYNQIARELRLFPSDEASREALSDCDVRLQAAVSSLRDLVERAPMETSDGQWIDDLARAQEELHRALDEGDPRPLNLAYRRINRILSIHPSRINTCLITSVRLLRLPALQRAMNSVRAHLATSDRDAEKVRRFTEGVDALARLNQRLTSLVSDHDNWQMLDDNLRQAGSDIARDLTDLDLSWPDLQTMAQRLYNAKTDEWALQLKADVEKLDQALVTRDPNKVRPLFRSFSARASERFFRVDVDLKNLSDELSSVGASLDAILGGVA